MPSSDARRRERDCVATRPRQDVDADVLVLPLAIALELPVDDALRDRLDGPAVEARDESRVTPVRVGSVALAETQPLHRVDARAHPPLAAYEDEVAREDVGRRLSRAEAAR